MHASINTELYLTCDVYKWLVHIRRPIDSCGPSTYLCKRNAAPWFDKELIKLRNGKNTARREAKRSNLQVKWCKNRKNCGIKLTVCALQNIMNISLN